MKILVVSDIHGNLSALEKVVQISSCENPDKTVFCGDLFGGWSSDAEIAETAQSASGVLYFVRGNNDRFAEVELCGQMEDNVIMYHFGRTLFFTHGDRYNGWNVPPLLKENDAVIFGHTHVSSLTFRNGLFVLNVGSVAYPRDGTPACMVLDESGATLRNLEGKQLYFLPWNTQNR